MKWFDNFFRGSDAWNKGADNDMDDILGPDNHHHNQNDHPTFWHGFFDFGLPTDTDDFFNGGMIPPVPPDESNVYQPQNPRDAMLKPDNSRAASPNHSYQEGLPQEFEDAFSMFPFRSVFGDLEQFFAMPVFEHPGIGMPGWSEPNVPQDRVDINFDESPSEAIIRQGPSYETAPGTVTRGFKSTSILRTRKPDGTVEEKRIYKDSSGREEETVTTYEGAPDNTIDIYSSDQDPSRKFSSILKSFMPRW